MIPTLNDEWLETDGLGGFASGTSQGVNTRRYHALLLSALNPPSDRYVFVNDLAISVTTPNGTYRVSQHHFAPDVLTERDAQLVDFSVQPWPTFRYQIEDFTLVQELVSCYGLPITLCRFRLEGAAKSVQLVVRPLLSGRSFHSLQRENSAFRFEANEVDSAASEKQWLFHPYASLPGVRVLANAHYTPEPHWYRQFRYLEEGARGLDDVEDLAAPGRFQFNLGASQACLVFAVDNAETSRFLAQQTVESVPQHILSSELARREAFHDPLMLAADAYIVRRGNSKTIIAGYPWFGDWGRDTFIALRGLCLATGRSEDAKSILLSWANVVSDGMLPNRFPDNANDALEYNSVDSALWYVIASCELLSEAGDGLASHERAALLSAIDAIVRGYRRGTRFGIGVAADGLLAAGVAGVQLTWMDAKVGDWVVTPRVGKPVEIQALWVNALALAEQWFPEFRLDRQRALQSFRERFFDAELGYLKDVVDVDHIAGKDDCSLRPNQIFALGGLPVALLPREQCRELLESVEAALATPLGPRSLAATDPAYRARYQGGVLERDGAYHQGTVWPWLAGPFIEAWVKAQGATPSTLALARERYLAPLYAHLEQAGIGHISEIADAEAPHVGRGCPFQAWSLAELLRLEQLFHRLAAQHTPTAQHTLTAQPNPAPHSELGGSPTIDSAPAHERASA